MVRLHNFPVPLGGVLQILTTFGIINLIKFLPIWIHMQWYLIAVLTWNFPLRNNVGHIFIYLFLPIYLLWWGFFCFVLFFFTFLIRFVISYWLILQSYLYLLKFFSGMCFANISNSLWLFLVLFYGVEFNIFLKNFDLCSWEILIYNFPSL